MDAEEIIRNLKATVYKFAYASKVKKDVQMLDRVDLRLLKIELRRQLKRPENRQLSRSLTYIVDALSELSFNLDYENDTIIVDEGYYV